eukprot:GCRY01006423.1.p1 GENE.GCRY01006423.1~~GCRY01006423.1.p1  ORF type:complete len:252 (+),score=69.68 GCRY01006423.1:427-1182(+)
MFASFSTTHCVLSDLPTADSVLTERSSHPEFVYGWHVLRGDAGAEALLLALAEEVLESIHSYTRALFLIDVALYIFQLLVYVSLFFLFFVPLKNKLEQQTLGSHQILRMVPDSCFLRPLAPWRKEYALNVSVVDRQHKVLFEIINRLYFGIMQMKGPALTGEVLMSLKHYTVYHFGMEEKIFDLTNYPDTESHKAAHRDLVATLIEFSEAYLHDPDSVSFELLLFIRSWLINHVLGTDTQYVSHFHQMGYY